MFTASGRFVNSPYSFFLGVHEGDHGSEDVTNVPGATPGLLMVVGEGSTNAFVDFKSAAIGEKLDFRGREGVVSRELQ